MRRLALAILVLLGLLTVWHPTPLGAQPGPFSAQIQRALAAFLAAGHTWTSAQTITLNALGTTSTLGFGCWNLTPATADVTVQISPECPDLSGAAYNSVSTLSETHRFGFEVLPATNAGTTTAILQLKYIAPGGAVTYPITLSNRGAFITLDTIDSGGSFKAAPANLIYWTARSLMSSPADGQWNLTNQAATAGIGVDVTTDSLGIVRNRAQNADAAWRAGPFVSSTATGLSVANVGANSCGTTAATIAGNNNAFVITVGATSGTQCRVAFTYTAATEWDCAASPQGTSTLIRMAPVDTTHADILGSLVAADKITAVCFPR